MWIKNNDNDKWYNQDQDTLPKEIFNSLEQAIGSVTLYSKALSGSTYVAINNLNNIYDILNYNNDYNWYIGGSNYSISNTPSSYGKSIDKSTEEEYYDKYIHEYGLTLKNKFTPVKLINDSIDNYFEVDVATTNMITNLGSYSPGLIIDGIILKQNHRVLVKDQISYVTLSPSVDPNQYFKGNYTIIQNNITSIEYSYYDQTNGIYGYTNSTLIRTNDLLTYDNVCDYSVSVKQGNTNILNQYFLNRLSNGYFPIYSEVDPIEFVEKKNWVLKNRVDYHNIYDISYHDIRKFNTQSYNTYTIPSRVISVGDFGMIVVYQGEISSIIDNKYKETLTSITETKQYYWICGYNGTLLKVDKLDFEISSINTNEFNNYNSISFFDDLNGIVVGDYNAMYFTQDGGYTWNDISSSDFDEYSYNRVIFYTKDKAYISGGSGLFIEMTYSYNNWILYKRSIIKYLDINEPTEEYLLVDDINDMCLFSFTSSNPWNLSGSNTDKDILLMCTNGGNILLYNLNEFISGTASEFLYLSFSQSTTDIQSITVISGSSSIYFASDNIYSIDINNFNIYNPITNNISSSYLPVNQYNFYANRIVDYEGQNLYLCGNSSTLKYSEYTSSLIDIDSDFNYRYNSKMLFLDYEIASKSNFFDITTQDYKLPNSLTFSSLDITNYISIDNISGENNWLSYYKDKQKTFQYYSKIDSSTEVLFSSTFSYCSSSYFTFSSIDINITYDGISLLAPNINSVGKSRFISGTTSINASTYSESIFLYKYLIVFKTSLTYPSDIGDVLHLNSDLISTTFIINKKVVIGSNIYIYCYVDFNQTLINDIKNYTGVLSINNLNKFSTISTGVPGDIIVNFGLHPISFGYSLTGLNNIYTLSSKYDSKTAYYNMQSLVSTNTGTYNMLYDTSFLKFGYKPTYNLYDYLNNVNSNFILSKPFLSMPKYQNLPGNGLNNFTHSNVYFDTNPGSVWPSNKLIFGSDFEFEWKSIWKNTFVDILLKTTPNSPTSIYHYQYYLYGTAGAVVYKLNGFNIDGTWDITNPLLFPDIYTNTSPSIYPYANVLTYNSGPWINSNGDIYSGRLNLSGVWTINKSYIGTISLIREIYIPKPGIYYIGIGCDNYSSITIDGNLLINQTSSIGGTNYLNHISDVCAFLFWHLYPVYLDSGYHLFEINGTNLGGPGLIGFEVYYGDENSLMSLSSIDNNLLYSSINIKDGDLLQYDTSISERMLVIDKYYDPTSDGYVIKFHTTLSYTYYTPIDFIDIISRNTLQQISDDLQVLNNIQRSQITKSIEINTSFTNLENPLNFKFPTDSYSKILLSDKDIKDNLSAIVFVDDKNELSLNIVKLEQQIELTITNTGRYITGSNDYLLLTTSESTSLNIGDGIVVTFNGGYYSSNNYNQNFFGYQIVTGIIGTNSFYTDRKWLYNNVDIPYTDPGVITFTKSDPFLNYNPVDIMEVGVDKQVKTSVEITPDNIILTGSSYSLININFNNYRYSLVDGLSVSSLYQNYGWILESDISNAIIGQDSNGVVWYSGDWRSGRWFGGTWISGRWISGDWYGGNWNSYDVTYKLHMVDVKSNYSSPTASKWYDGRWYDGVWGDGTWYNGRRYGGTWSNGTWYNGIWNGGNWYNGIWVGGIWITGNWYDGVFNCDNNPSYWIDGNWYGGDFENGMWYNGQFTQINESISRFGTKAFNTRTAIWQSGQFSNGEFHSYLNTDIYGNTIASEFNKYSIWNTGIFSGTWYGGVAYAINFNSATWYGGVIEEIQVIGITITTGQLTKLLLNGKFLFNMNDKICVVNDNTFTPYAAIGTNTNPGYYTILLSEEVNDPIVGESTLITLNQDLTNVMGGTVSVNDTDTGLRLTANFSNSVWKRGIWTNGVFQGNSYFEGGIWYGGNFSANWGY